MKISDDMTDFLEYLMLFFTILGMAEILSILMGYYSETNLSHFLIIYGCMQYRIVHPYIIMTTAGLLIIMFFYNFLHVRKQYPQFRDAIYHTFEKSTHTEQEKQLLKLIHFLMTYQFFVYMSYLMTHCKF